MEYKVITYNRADLLEEMVNEIIGFGWEPIGGVSLTIDNYGKKVWLQAMIKR